MATEFLGLLEAGARLRPAGQAKNDPAVLVKAGYLPRTRIDLYGNRIYLARARKNPAVRFFVAYVVPPVGSAARTAIYPRIFYKDLSLVWRAASHLVANDHEFWIGKGSVEKRWENGYEHVESKECTTDLPLEIQNALEEVNRAQRRVIVDDIALLLVLRNAPHGRVEPYRDFAAPRDAAAADPRNRINRGRPVARFTRRHDPTSLVFVRGFEPDFDAGILEVGDSSSRLYGGMIRRYRILSTNRKIQYLFMAGPRHVWLVPPQATTTELSTYAVRTVDVPADDDLFVPGYEYHYYEDDVDPPYLVSQIPPGFVGAQTTFDPTRADASKWLDRLPVVREFRRRVLRRRRSSAGS